MAAGNIEKRGNSVRWKQIRVGWARAAVTLAICGVLPGSVFGATTITNPYAGVTRHSVTNATVNGRSVNYQVIVINTLDAGISFFLTPDNGAAPYETARQTTRNFALAYETEFAINAHFFDTSLSPNTDNTGIAASNGTVYSPFELTGGLAALNLSQENFPETVTGVAGGTTFASSSAQPYTTINTGSMLIRDGAVVNTGATDRRARSQIGASRDGSALMFFASSSGMTEQEGATILVEQFGAFHVHGLDGGGSTTLVQRTGATTQSIIAIENSFSERAVGTNLGVQAAPFVAGIPDAMTWDAAPGTPGVQQGGGAWDFSMNNWVADGSNRTWANPKTPTLGAGGGALITLGDRIAVRDMAIDGGYTLGLATGPTMTILGNLTTTGSQPTTINAPLGNASSFRKMGAQTLSLGSSSRISMLNLGEGVMDLGGNTLTIIDPLVPMTVTGGIIQNGALVFTDSAPDLAAPSGSTTIATSLTSPRITKVGAGAVYLTGNNSWTGALQVAEGTLGFGPSATIPNTAVTVSRGLLDLAGASATIGTLNLGGPATTSSAVATGSGTLTLNGTLTYNGTNSPAGAAISGKVNLPVARTFAVNDSTAASDDLTVSADITGAFALTKTGNGTLVLSGANTFSSYRNAAGVTRSGASEVLGNGTLTLDSGTIDLAGFDETIGSTTLGGVAGVTPEIQTGGGLLSLNGSLTYSATNNGLGAWIRGRIHLGSTLRTFTIGNSTNADIDTRIDASITGTAGLTKAGAGRLEIAGPISLSGTFTVNNGEVLLSNPNSALPAVTLGGIAGVQPVLDTGSTTASLNGLLAYSSGNNGLGSILRGRLDLGSALRTFTINNSTNAPVDMKIEAALDGIAGFTKNGAGTLELAGINSLTGPVSCTAGVLSISNAQAFAAVSSVSISSGGALDFTTLPSATFVVSRPDLVISGVGNVIGNLSLAGGRLASPGSGNLTISGDLVATSGTTEIKTGSSPGGIVVSGNATLGGRLEVTMGGSLTGTQTVTLLTANSISGSYASVQLPTPPAGTVYALETTGTQVRMRVFPGSASQAWLGGNGIAIDAPLTSDPDGDGVSLLEEYALGGSPTGSDSHLTSAASTAAGTELRFNWNTAATDINGFVEASSDLQSWTTILSKTGSSPWTGTASFSQGTPVGSVFPIIVRDPIPTLPRFLRVRAVKP